MTRLTNKIKGEILYNWVGAKKRKAIVAAYDALGAQYAKLISDVYQENIAVAVTNSKLVDGGYISTLNHATLPYRYQQATIDSGVVCNVLGFRDGSIGQKSFNIDPIAVSTRYFSISQNIDADLVAPIFKRFDKKIDAIQVDIVKVQDVIFSVTTIKKLLDILPEFSKYIPELEEKTMQLIPINVVNDVKALL